MRVSGISFRGRSRLHRPGIAMMLLLLALTIGTILAVNFLVAQSTTIGISQNLQSQVRARLIAESALAFGVKKVKATTTWRTDFPNGVWASNIALAGGTFTLKGEDGVYNNPTDSVIGDGDLTNNPTDSVTVTAIGTYGGVSHSVHSTIKCVGSSNSKALLVVPDPSTPAAQTLARKTQLTNWGYAVTLISDASSQSAFDAAVAALVTNTDNAVIYIASNSSATNIGAKLLAEPVGIVCEPGLLANEFGITNADGSATSSSSFSITNNTHYITTPWTTGSLTLTNSSQPMWSYGGTMALSGSVLAGASPGLLVIDVDGVLVGGSTFAAGRRVLMPWGGSSFDYTTLNADGKTLLQRALYWASIGGGSGGPVNSGFQTAFGSQQKNVNQMQVATKVAITRAGTLTGMTAYVQGPPPKLVRYAVYSDSGGEPGSLLGQTASGVIINNSPYWHSLTLPNIAVSAGTYWLALSFEHSNEGYFYDTNAAGQYRMIAYDAVTNGFKSSWGTSTTSGIRRISIYANIIPASTNTGSGGSTSGSGTGAGGTYTYTPVVVDEP